MDTKKSFLNFAHREVFFLLSFLCIFFIFVILLFFLPPNSIKLINSNTLLIMSLLVFLSLVVELYITRYKNITIDQYGIITLVLMFGIIKKFNIQDIVSCTLFDTPLIWQKNLYSWEGNPFRNTLKFKKVTSPVVLLKIRTKHNSYSILSFRDVVLHIQSKIPPNIFFVKPEKRFDIFR